MNAVLRKMARRTRAIDARMRKRKKQLAKIGIALLPARRPPFRPRPAASATRTPDHSRCYDPETIACFVDATAREINALRAALSALVRAHENGVKPTSKEIAAAKRALE